MTKPALSRTLLKNLSDSELIRHLSTTQDPYLIELTERLQTSNDALDLESDRLKILKEKWSKR